MLMGGKREGGCEYSLACPKINLLCRMKSTMPNRKDASQLTLGIPKFRVCCGEVFARSMLILCWGSGTCTLIYICTCSLDIHFLTLRLSLALLSFGQEAIYSAKL